MIEPETSGDNAGWVRNGGGYLARYFDAGLEPPADLSVEVIKGDEIGRLCESLAIVIYASSLPRRLGGDAMDEDLALDKKRSRRVAHALTQSLRGWAGKAAAAQLTDEIRRAGAQLVWEKFRDEHAAHINARMRLVATWSLRYEQQQFGKSAIVKYENELRWVSYALRD